jgi:hypothetical protein
MTNSLPSHPVLRPACQLIVLFPASAPVNPDQANRIWEIARSERANVLLLSLTNDIEEEYQVRRKLISLAAIIRYPGVSADIRVEHGSNWVRQVERIRQAGDILACFEGHKVGLLHKCLDQVLESKLDVPIYLLKGYQPATNPSPAFWSKVALWLGSFLIIGGFLWAEATIVELPQDWGHTVLVYLIALILFVSLWFWNSLFT